MWLHTKVCANTNYREFHKNRIVLTKQTTAEYAEYFASCPCWRGFTLPEQKARILNEFKDGIPQQFNLTYFI